MWRVISWCHICGIPGQSYQEFFHTSLFGESQNQMCSRNVWMIWIKIGVWLGHTCRIRRFKYLRVNISSDMTWTVNTAATVKNGPQMLHFLRFLNGAQLPQQLLINFYRPTIESILTYCISVWVENRKALWRITKMADRIIGTQLPRLEDVYQTCSTGRITGINKALHTPEEQPLP